MRATGIPEPSVDVVPHDVQKLMEAVVILTEWRRWHTAGRRPDMCGCAAVLH